MKIEDILQPIEEELRARITILILKKKMVNEEPIPPCFKDLFDELNRLEECWKKREAVVDACLEVIRTKES